MAYAYLQAMRILSSIESMELISDSSIKGTSVALNFTRTQLPGSAIDTHAIEQAADKLLLKHFGLPDTTEWMHDGNKLQLKLHYSSIKYDAAQLAHDNVMDELRAITTQHERN